MENENTSKKSHFLNSPIKNMPHKFFIFYIFLCIFLHIWSFLFSIFRLSIKVGKFIWTLE